MFLGLLMSCDKKKLKNKAIKNLLLKTGLRNLKGLIVEASESAKVCGQFHVFGNFLQYFF